MVNENGPTDSSEAWIYPSMRAQSVQYGLSHRVLESVHLFNAGGRTPVAERISTVADAGDRDNHCAVVALTRCVPCLLSSRRSCDIELGVAPRRRPTAERDLAVPVGFNNQWLSLNDRACLRARQPRPGQPHRGASTGHRPRAMAATLS